MYDFDTLCLFTAGEFKEIGIRDPDLGLFSAGEFGCEPLVVFNQREFDLNVATVQVKDLNIATVQVKDLGVATVIQKDLGIATVMTKDLNIATVIVKEL